MQTMRSALRCLLQTCLLANILFIAATHAQTCYDTDGSTAGIVDNNDWTVNGYGGNLCCLGLDSFLDNGYC